MLVSKKPGRPNASANQPNVSTNQPNMSANQPNVSRWNIGCVGSPGVGVHVGHVQGCRMHRTMSMTMHMNTRRLVGDSQEH